MLFIENRNFLTGTRKEDRYTEEWLLTHFFRTESHKSDELSCAVAGILIIFTTANGTARNDCP